ncbi:lytic polysaccharide monooxygenase, partial [Patellaria atrata CBS 101060]
MTLRRLKSFLCTLCVLLSISDHVTGHVQMSNPMPLRSPLDTQDMGGVKDYDMTSPLRADGSNFPCKGYHLDSPLRTTARYQAGSTYTAQFLGGATHDGGSCQLSLSYDGGKTFKVIKSVVGGCPLAGSYPFTVPSYAPAGIALFAWTWMNKVGNREFYMDCAAVQIVGQNSAGRRLAKRAQSMDDLPNIWVANLRGINTCSTFEGLNPVFPHPGDDVVYGDGMSSAS